MAYQTVPKATVRDVEAALGEQQGRGNITQLALTETYGAWTYRLPRGWAKCAASTTPDGVGVSISFYMPPWLWILFSVLAVVGLVACVVPGLVVIGIIGIRVMIVSGFLKLRFPAFVEAVRLAQSKRTATGAVTPLVTEPSPSSPPPITPPVIK